MYERAAGDAAALARRVDSRQHTLPTPCAEWDVGALLEHLAGGSAYLLDAVGGDPGEAAAWPDASAVAAVVARLRDPGALERRSMSPAGFEWSAAEAAAGTAMDQLIHTWDLAVAVGDDPTLDSGVVEAVVAMFLPAMPDIGREAGIVGPAVAVADDASAQDRLLGAMGRDPGR